MSLTSYNLYQHSCFDKNNDLEKNTSLELAEHPNSINSTSNNIKMIRNVSQYNASSFDEQNKVLSGMHNFMCFVNYFNLSYVNLFFLFRIYKCN